MAKKVTRRAVLGSSVLALSAGLSGCTAIAPVVQNRQEFDRTFDLSEGTMTVAASGSVTVSRTDADAVELRGVKESNSVFTDLEDAAVETTRDGDRLSIDANPNDRRSILGGSVSISVEIGVPEGVAVERASALDGGVTVTGVGGDVRAESVNGRVDVRDVDGVVSLASTNGSLRARDVAGFGGAEAVNGDVDVEIPAIDGDVTVSSVNGDVDAALGTDLDATVLATVDNGSVHASGLSLADRQSSDDFLRGTLGDGTHELTFESENGRIDLSRLGGEADS